MFAVMELADLSAAGLLLVPLAGALLLVAVRAGRWGRTGLTLATVIPLLAALGLAAWSLLDAGWGRIGI